MSEKKDIRIVCDRCGQEENKLRRDCYFFSEVQDMGGRIPTCKIRRCLGYCPCDRCDLFFSVKDAENAIYAIFEKQTGGADNGNG